MIVGMVEMVVTSCARMGQPDGGWYDERPPRIVSTSPQDNAVNVDTKKITIRFDEYIKLENPSEKVIISPPQHEQPEIKAGGKSITIELLDTLKENTTYTIDFTDAITDNNEGNPLGNYSYSFSTGAAIDTLQVAGYVLNAENLEPVKGIYVCLSKAGESGDSGKSGTSSESGQSGKSPAPVAISRTDSRGHFVIRGVAPGSYTIGAVQDADGDYLFSQRSEMMAFSHDVIVPSCFGDTRQDTLWADANHIKDIAVSGYTHFMPDDVTLLAFNHKLTDRHFLKADRTSPDHFTLYFTAGCNTIPEIYSIPSNTSRQFLVESSLQGDTVTYWLTDTAMVNQDTLHIAMTTYITDTLGIQQLQTDTLEILAKTPYAKRLKAKQDKLNDWKKDLARRLKHALPEEVIDTIPPREYLVPDYKCPQTVAPDATLRIHFPTPLARIDSAAIHLYVEQDSLWFRAPFEMNVNSSIPSQSTFPGVIRSIDIFTDWIPGARYSFEVDSLAFTDIYGKTNERYKAGIQTSRLEDYASLFVEISSQHSPSSNPSESGNPGANVIVQLLDDNDTPHMTAPAIDGTAEFYYVTPGKYYLRAFIDYNANGIWDTGDYYLDQQPEPVYYYPDQIECKAKWDITKSWNLTSRPVYKQKPGAITKQKPDAEKQIKNRNIDRARQKGIEIPARYR